METHIILNDLHRKNYLRKSLHDRINLKGYAQTLSANSPNAQDIPLEHYHRFSSAHDIYRWFFGTEHEKYRALIRLINRIWKKFEDHAPIKDLDGGYFSGDPNYIMVFQLIDEAEIDLFLMEQWASNLADWQITDNEWEGIVDEIYYIRHLMED